MTDMYYMLACCLLENRQLGPERSSSTLLRRVRIALETQLSQDTRDS